MERNFGRYHAPDPRDKKHRIIVSRSARRYRYWQDTGWFGDQGAEGSCVGFAWAHWLYGAPFQQHLNPRGIYHLAQFCDEWDGEDYEGTSVRAGAKVLDELGFIEAYKWAWDLDRVVNTILEKGPVVVGTNWYEGMLDTDSEGFVWPDGDSVGGHAYVLNGVNRTGKIVRLKNSWGESWGVAGRAWMTFESLARLLEEDGEACIGVEKIVRVV